MTHHSPERDRLEEAHQAGVWLEGETIERAVLDGLQIPGAAWKDVNLRRSNLNEADLSNILFQDVEIANTGLRTTRFIDGWWDSVRVTLCDLAQLDLTGTTLRDVVFEESPMPFGCMDRAVMSRVSFRVVDLQSTSMQEAALLHCQFRDERLGGANLMSTDLRGAVLVDCNLAQANLQGANLDGAILIGVDLRGANLDGVSAEGAVAYDVQGGGSVFRQLPEARDAHLALHRRVARQGVAARLAVELAWSSMVEGTQAIQGNRDVASQLLRQRNLGFADLIRFIKERFQHRELDKLVVDGDQVGVRTETGTVPITEYSGGARMGQTATRPAARANPDAKGIDSFRRPPSGPAAMAMGEPAPEPSRRETAPAAQEPARGGGRRPADAAKATENQDVFADSRFGLIDLDEEDPE